MARLASGWPSWHAEGSNFKHLEVLVEVLPYIYIYIHILYLYMIIYGVIYGNIYIYIIFIWWQYMATIELLYGGSQDRHHKPWQSHDLVTWGHLHGLDVTGAIKSQIARTWRVISPYLDIFIHVEPMIAGFGKKCLFGNGIRTPSRFVWLWKVAWWRGTHRSPANIWSSL